MKTFFSLAGTASVALLVAGCNTTGSNGGNGGGGNGGTPTNFASATSALEAYSATNPPVYDADNPQDMRELVRQSGGVAFLGTGRNAGSATDQHVFKLGNIEVEQGGNSVTLTLDGRSRTLNFAGSEGDSDFFSIDAYGYLPSDPRDGEVVVVGYLPSEDSDDYRDSPSYISLIMHLDAADWQKFEDEGDEYYLPGTIRDFNVLIAGTGTPVSDLPNAEVAYRGQWFQLAEGALTGNLTDGTMPVSDLSLTADFNSNRVSGFVGTPDDEFAFTQTTALSGTIVGNGFHGDMERVDPLGINGQFVGGFFGPAAEQIGGTGTGSILVDGQESPASVAFVGIQEER